MLFNRQVFRKTSLVLLLSFSALAPSSFAAESVEDNSPPDAQITSDPNGPVVKYSSFKMGVNKYALNGEIIISEAPYISEGTLLLPLRMAAYALGIGDNSIVWDQETDTVSIRGFSRHLEDNGAVTEKVVLLSTTVNSNEMLVNGKKVLLERGSERLGDTIMLPARAISEAFGCEVHWLNKADLVLIGLLHAHKGE